MIKFTNCTIEEEHFARSHYAHKQICVVEICKSRIKFQRLMELEQNSYPGLN